MSDSVAANNGHQGVVVESSSAPTAVMVRNSTIANNVDIGLWAIAASATLRVTRSTITGNGIGWSTSNSGTVSSYSDNNVDGNGADGVPTGTLAPK